MPPLTRHEKDAAAAVCGSVAGIAITACLVLAVEGVISPAAASVLGIYSLGVGLATCLHAEDSDANCLTHGLLWPLALAVAVLSEAYRILRGR
jgi:hypothetical protein